MDIGHNGETRESPPDPDRCPSCRVPYRSALDRRYGYCWDEHDFMGEPTDFVFLGDEAFGERVRDKVRHMEPRPIQVMTDEERERMWATNLAAFREHERWAVSVMSPGTALIGAAGLGARLYEKRPTLRQRVRDWLRGSAQGGEVRPLRIDPEARLYIGLSPGARLLMPESTRRQRLHGWLRARLSVRR